MQKKHDGRIKQGYPWVKKNDIIEDSSLVISDPGDPCTIVTASGEPVAVGYYNNHSMIAARVMSTNVKKPIDETLISERLRTAMFKRDKLIGDPYYRLVHSEGDQLPGLVIDRFGSSVVVQISTAGMERMLPWVIAALDKWVKPETIVLRNDTPSREKEGLTQEVKVIKGEVPDLTLVKEYGSYYFADLLKGQKTGWFYDQRDNRNYLAEFAHGKSMLDMFCHSGGFGIAAAKAGASRVLMVDSSELALSLAQKNIAYNKVDSVCSIRRGKAFQTLEALAKEKQRFDVISLDPPAFAKTRKDKESGISGYERLGFLSAALTGEGGIVMLTSCSHHASKKEVERAVRKGLEAGGRKVELVSVRGAAPDHPAHPLLPENDYLKSVTFRMVS
ncbi:MAG: class I SAM-dependent rRNA methyltransferase [Proteobacteria bacterium]|nr:class I SAM-dependent rRNA methyltransferase [Pseudomonadota bacterium]